MTEPFKEFRAPKVSLWARLLGDWRARRRAKKARKMKHHIATVMLYRKTSTGRLLRAYIHLYETGAGKRSYVYERGEFVSVIDYKEYEAYHNGVIPWLHGKYDNKTITRWAAETYIKV